MTKEEIERALMREVPAQLHAAVTLVREQKLQFAGEAITEAIVVLRIRLRVNEALALEVKSGYRTPAGEGRDTGEGGQIDSRGCNESDKGPQNGAQDA